MSSTSKLLAALPVLLLLGGCGEKEIPLPYGSLEGNLYYSIEESASEANEMTYYAAGLCAVAEDVTDTSSIDTSGINAAGSYDLDDLTVKYSYQANERVSPASLTKIMTALLVLENCPDLDVIVTIGDVTIREEGAQLFHLAEGDTIRLKDLLALTMIYSANDGAIALAQYVGGDVDTFVEMMNERAKSLGATNTHFVNPHGLTADDHYTTAYDLYLMFNAAVQYEEFREIIHTVNYTVNYNAADGSDVSKEVTTTNRFLTENYTFSGDIEVIGGKTGSTNAAGKCIILYAMEGEKPYITVVMGAGDTDALYRMAKQLMEDTM